MQCQRCAPFPVLNRARLWVCLICWQKFELVRINHATGARVFKQLS